MTSPNILLWDIETTNLEATFGTILCIGWKWLGGERVHIHSLFDDGKDHLDDHTLVKKFAQVFDKADIHVTWYGDRFDLPFVRSKLIKYGEPPLPPKPHLDLWKTARYRFKLHSNRLAVWQEYLECKQSKTPIRYDDWLKAAVGDKRALAAVKEHNRRDVLVLEEVFNKIRPWLEKEPARGLFYKQSIDLSCPSCGSTNIKRRGFQVAITRKYQRFQCFDCGKWMKKILSEKDKKLHLIGVG